MLAAAALVVAAMAIGVQAVRDDQLVATADRPSTQSSTEIDGAIAAGQRFCSGSFAEFAAGIAGWGGVRNWSFLTDSRNPEPHLPTLAFAVLDELEPLVGDPELERSRSELEDALASADDLPGFTPEIRGRVEQGLTGVIDTVRSILQAEINNGSLQFTACDLGSFSAEG